MTKPEKPRKPYKDFPLFPHENGQWAKKINSQFRYFGVWDDPDAAILRYEREREALYAGREPNDLPGTLSIADCCNHFLGRKQTARDSGRITDRTYQEYKQTAETVLNNMGRTRSIESLTPSDFLDLLTALSKRFGPVRLANEVTRIKAIFRHATEYQLIERPVVFGPDFKKPSRRELRVSAAKQIKLFSAAEICKLLKGSAGPFHAMVLLGINCGLGNRECGQLQWRHLNLVTAWLDFARNKTGIARRAKLWPATVRSLKALQAVKTTDRDDLVFETRFGNSWAADTHNPISLEFRKLSNATKTHVEGRGFYCLRHTFRTVASGCCDKEAVDHIMGHRSEHVSSTYTHGIADKRLEIAASHVRRWLQKSCKLVS